MDPPLAKAEPIRDGGSASGTAYLRKQKNPHNSICRGMEEWETTLQTPRSVRNRGRRCSRRWSRDSPAAHGGDHGEAGCPPTAHAGLCWSRYTSAAWGGPHARAGGCLKESVNLWGAHTGAGFWQDLGPRRERNPCWSRFAGRACDPVGDPLHWFWN